ncbi:MAG: FkbM family methyltransferase [Cyanobacteriota bacterium]
MSHLGLKSATRSGRDGGRLPSKGWPGAWHAGNQQIPFHLIKQFIAEWKYSLLGKFKGYGLEGLDLRLLAHLHAKQVIKGGYFVELGANNGLFQSNTYLLQQRFGWTGLLIEPSPVQYIQCVRNRSFGQTPQFRCAACVDFGYQRPFVEMSYSDLMTVSHGLNIDHETALKHAERGRSFLRSKNEAHMFGALARTLTSLLDEVCAPYQFEFLSLDVEGNEMSVLRGLDFARYQPRWILVESRSDDISNFLCSHGYQQSAILSDHGNYYDILFEWA